jgi:hypothetical protein
MFESLSAPQPEVASFREQSGNETGQIPVDGQAPDQFFGLIELILKDGPSLEKACRTRLVQPRLIPRLLAVALLGFTLYGLVVAIVIHSSGVWPRLTSIADVLAGRGGRLLAFDAVQGLGPWFDGSAFRLVAAYSLGLVAAVGVCLPSLYFYGLLSAIRMTMLDVVTQSLKAIAVTAIVLIGILPIYAAVAMGVIIFQLPAELRNVVLEVGLVLPFVAGLVGILTLHVGFAGLADSMPSSKFYGRKCFLRRLVWSWSAIYTAVTPVMIFTLWEYLMRW